MSLFHQVKSITQIIALVFSLLINSILILLVIHKSPKKIGNYKWLMCYFCGMSIFYACLDYVVQPYLHQYGASFSMIMDLRESVFLEYRNVAFFLTATLAACFGVSIYAIAVNFVYRFFALQREGRLRYFSGHRLFVWMSIPFIAGIFWLAAGWFWVNYDEEMAEYIGQEINATYGLDWHSITFTGGMYYKVDQTGETRWRMKNTLGAGVMFLVMQAPFLTICYFGYQSHRRITTITDNGESDYSRRVQKQLYQALMGQTAIPIIFLFFPIGGIFAAPLIHVEVGRFCYLVTFFFTFYPVFDPLPTLLFVDEFRNGLFKVVRRGRQVSGYSSQGIVN